MVTFWFTYINGYVLNGYADFVGRLQLLSFAQLILYHVSNKTSLANFGMLIHEMTNNFKTSIPQ